MSKGQFFAVTWGIAYLIAVRFEPSGWFFAINVFVFHGLMYLLAWLYQKL